MTFTLLPAVDVANGQAVRLVQGQAGTETAHGSPLAAALSWQADGAEWIHLVDLDAALGRGNNTELLATVVGELDVNVELSAGIRDDASLDWALATGCERVIIGTAALADPAWCDRAIASHGERIACSLDVRIVGAADNAPQHRLSARGSTLDVGDLWETIAHLDRSGCARYVVTDVSRDGMLNGPNTELYAAIAQATSTPIIASGGISAIDDLVLLASLATMSAGVEGSIVGKALYEHRFTLAEAIAAVRGVES